MSIDSGDILACFTAAHLVVVATLELPLLGGDSRGTGIDNLPKLPQHPALGAAADAAPGVGPNQNNSGGRARTVATDGGKCTMSHAVGGGMAGLSGLPPACLVSRSGLLSAYSSTVSFGSTTEIE